MKLKKRIMLCTYTNSSRERTKRKRLLLLIWILKLNVIFYWTRAYMYVGSAPKNEPLAKVYTWMLFTDKIQQHTKMCTCHLCLCRNYLTKYMGKLAMCVRARWTTEHTIGYTKHSINIWSDSHYEVVLCVHKLSKACQLDGGARCWRTPPLPHIFANFPSFTEKLKNCESSNAGR